MGSDTFTGIVSFIYKKHNTTTYKYAIINSQCPINYIKNLEHFKNIYDLNSLVWTTSKTKIYEIAYENENLYPTTHGIVSIDYTKDEPLEIKIMYSSEYKNLIVIKNVLSVGFNVILHIVYLVFIIKLYSNLFY